MPNQMGRGSGGHGGNRMARPQKQAASQGGRGGPSIFNRVIDLATRPLQGVEGAISNTLQHKQNSPLNPLTGFLAGWSGHKANGEQGKYSGQGLAKQAGLHGWQASAVGLGADIGLDPLTYLTFGVGGAAKGALSGTELAAKGIEGGAKAAETAGTAAKLAESINKVDKLSLGTRAGMAAKTAAKGGAIGTGVGTGFGLLSGENPKDAFLHQGLIGGALGAGGGAIHGFKGGGLEAIPKAAIPEGEKTLGIKMHVPFTDLEKTIGSRKAYQGMHKIMGPLTESDLGDSIRKMFRTDAGMSKHMSDEYQTQKGLAAQDFHAYGKQIQEAAGDLTKAERTSVTNHMVEGLDHQLTGQQAKFAGELRRITNEVGGKIKTGDPLSNYKVPSNIPAASPEISKMSSGERLVVADSKTDAKIAAAKGDISVEKLLTEADKGIGSVKDTLNNLKETNPNLADKITTPADIAAQPGFNKPTETPGKQENAWNALQTDKQPFGVFDRKAAVTLPADEVMMNHVHQQMFKRHMGDFQAKMTEHYGPGLMSDPELAPVMKHAQATFTPGTVESKQFLRAWDKAQGVLKTLQVGLNPGSIMKHYLGHAFLDFQSGVVNPLAFERGGRLALLQEGKGKDFLIKVGKDKIPASKILEDYHAKGGRGQLVSGELLPEGAKSKVLNRIARSANTREESLRLTNFSDSIVRGGKYTPEAVNAAHESLRKWSPSYGNLTSTEKHIRRFIPYYNVIRQSAPKLMHALITNPSKITIVPKGVAAINSLLGTDDPGALPGLPRGLPPWLDPGQTILSGGGTKAHSVPMENYLQEAFSPIKMAKGGLTPFIKTPMELQGGHRLDTGAKLFPKGMKGGELASYLVNQVGGPGRLAGNLANAATGTKTAHTQTESPDIIHSLLSYAGGPATPTDISSKPGGRKPSGTPRVKGHTSSKGNRIKTTRAKATTGK